MEGTVALRQKALESLLFEVGIFISLLKQQTREIWLPALYSKEAQGPTAGWGQCTKAGEELLVQGGGPIITLLQMA